MRNIYLLSVGEIISGTDETAQCTEMLQTVLG